MSKKPEKFKPVDVRPKPCSDSERDHHLRAFIATFVEPDRRRLARHILLESPQKAHGELGKMLEHWVRQDLTTELLGSSSFPTALERRFRSARGIYIDASLQAASVTAPEAATLAPDADAIFSLEPGKTAIIFHHSGASWLCEKNPV